MKLNLKHLASVLAVTGLLITGSAGAQNAAQGDLGMSDRQSEGTRQQPGAVDTTAAAPAPLPAGIALKENARTRAVEEAVRNVLKTATDAVLAGNTNKLVEQLSHPDRERLQAETPIDLNPLTQATGVLKKTFNEAYGLTSDLTDQDLAATNMTITVGEIADPNALTNWPVDPIAGTKITAGSTEPSVSRGPVGTIWRGAARSASGLVNKKYMAEGRDVAVVVLPPAAGIPELTVSMTHEAVDFWKIDIPDNMSLATLQRNLSEQIDKFSKEAKSWPPDQNETERLLARRVLIALYDVDNSATPGATSTGSSGGAESSSPGMTQ